jgi:hypothetical protein
VGSLVNFGKTFHNLDCRVQLVKAVVIVYEVLTKWIQKYSCHTRLEIHV